VQVVRHAVPLGRLEVPAEVFSHCRRVHRVRAVEARPAGACHADRCRARVRFRYLAIDEPSRFHALHESAQARLAIARMHQRLEVGHRQASRTFTACQVREQREHARIDTGVVLERAHDIV